MNYETFKTFYENCKICKITTAKRLAHLKRVFEATNNQELINFVAGYAAYKQRK